jgi:hypothetical protein
MVAEEFAQPSYKWIGGRHLVDNLQGWRISLFVGGIGFSFFNYSNEKGLRVELALTREDGAVEYYLSDAYYCGEWGGGWQKWQTDRLPLFPYEGLHGLVESVRFSYSILKDDAVIPSRYEYRFASLGDFYRGHLRIDDFQDPAFKRERDGRILRAGGEIIQGAYDRLNRDAYGALVMTPFFTRGDTGRRDHPVHEIHRAIDRVIERARRDPGQGHSIRLAMYDFDNDHVTRHLAYAKENGVEVECIGDWAQVSSMNASEHIARLRRAGIRVYGMVRNDPLRRGEDIASMHTKFILFDDEVVHSASYNLHFSPLGRQLGERRALLLAGCEPALRGDLRCDQERSARETRRGAASTPQLYYSFGRYRAGQAVFRPQDAIVTEIVNARESIVVCMFDLSFLRGLPLGGRETDVISALIAARDRGVGCGSSLTA